MFKWNFTATIGDHCSPSEIGNYRQVLYH